MALIQYGILEALFIFLACVPSQLLFFFLLIPIKETGKIDFFQPPLFFFANIFLGVSCRAIWIVFSTSDKVEIMFTFDQELTFFFYSILLINISVISFLLGYSIKLNPTTRIIHKLFQHDNWKKVNVYFTSLLLLICALWGISIFLQSMGVSTLAIENISQKRMIKVEGTNILSSNSYYRWMASLGGVGFIFFFTYYLNSKKKKISIDTLFLIILFFVAILLPFLTNARVGIIAIFLNASAIWYYHRGLSLKLISIVSTIVIVVTLITSAFRPSFGNAKSFGEATSKVNFNAFIDIFIANRNLLGITKTAHIVHAIPDKLDYKYGQTFFLWVYAPIPRAIWPQKPIIGVGAEDTMKEIFNIPQFIHSGVPPGIVAESYWNFGVLGVFSIMFILGIILKKTHRVLLPYILKKNKNSIILYIYITYTLGFLLPATSVSASIITLLTSLIPIIIIIKIFQIK